MSKREDLPISIVRTATLSLVNSVWSIVYWYEVARPRDCKTLSKRELLINVSSLPLGGLAFKIEIHAEDIIWRGIVTTATPEDVADE
jgi:hypothetical protein